MHYPANIMYVFSWTPNCARYQYPFLKGKSHESNCSNYGSVLPCNTWNFVSGVVIAKLIYKWSWVSSTLGID